MLHKIKRIFFFFIAFTTTILADPENTLYHQVNEELLKTVNVESPSEEEARLITVCQLNSQFGKATNTASNEQLQTLVNNKTITSVLPVLLKPYTLFGKTAAAYQFASLTTDRTTLQRRKNLLRALDNKPALAMNLNGILQKTVEAEQAFIKATTQWLNNQELFKELYFSSSMFSNLNESPCAHEIAARSQLALFALPLAIGPIAEKLYLDFCTNVDGSLQNLAYAFQEASIKENLAGFKNLSVNAFKAYYDFMKTIPTHIKDNTIYNCTSEVLNCKFDCDPNSTKTKVIATSITSIVYAYGAFYAYNKLKAVYNEFKLNKKTFDNVYEQQKVLIKMNTLINNMKEISDFINEDSDIQKLIPEQEQLAELFDTKSKTTSQDLKKLIQLLLSSSFEGDESYFLSQQGKILATYHLLMRVYEELIPYLQAFGNIDATIAAFNLYNNYKNHPNAQICIANFIDQEKPMISAQEFWHPLINANAVVTNNIEVGTNQNNSNLIITGPNAGGKTTTLTALMTNIILAQTFGIATASNFTVTPFTKVHSYLDITTNLIKGESLFKAEVNRSKALKESVASCSNNEKSFTIIDEIFSGTNQEVAAELGVKFAQGLGNIPHSMTIITTHIPEMTTLEEITPNFENFKVADAIIAEDKSIIYPFKLIKGKSTQNIAEQMLEQEGIL